MFSLFKENMKALLESSMSDFENNQLDKIVKKVTKHQKKIETSTNQDHTAYDHQLTLTEGILFPKEIKEEIITPLRKEVNQFLYDGFTYHSLFGVTRCEPYNLKNMNYTDIDDFFEKVFIDNYLVIDTIYSNYYKNIEAHLSRLNIESELKSQGLTIAFNNLNKISSFLIEIEFILSDSYNKMIVDSINNQYVLKTSFVHFINSDNYLNNTIKYFGKETSTELISEGSFKNLDFSKITETEFHSFKYINNIFLEIDRILIKHKKLIIYSKKEDDSIIFIPKNEKASYIYDYGYFNEEAFRRLIQRSRKVINNYNSDKRTTDLNYLINNFKFI